MSLYRTALTPTFDICLVKGRLVIIKICITLHLIMAL